MISEMSDAKLYVLVGLLLVSIFVVVMGVLQTVTEIDLLSLRCTAGFVLGYLVNLVVWFLVYVVYSDVERGEGSEG